MKRIVVGITGASGAAYGVRLLEVLRECAETHLVITPRGEWVIAHETSRTAHDLQALASRTYDCHDFSSALASGSFGVDAMVVVPCSMKTLSGIAYSYSANLLMRAADVTLKEKRRLVLVVRETPLHWGHLDTMRRASAMGAMICPPVPALYQRPRSVADIIDSTVGKVLDLVGIDHNLCARWGEEQLPV